ncbi:hypothetical protein GCM10027605_69840 [Micromonospora zhanjiangensis]
MTDDPLAPLLDLADIAPAVARTRERVDQAMRHRALRRQGGQVAAEVSLRCAVASAALEGYAHERETVRAGTITDPVPQGALRVAGALPGLADRWPKAPGRRWPGCTYWRPGVRCPRPRSAGPPATRPWRPGWTPWPDCWPAGQRCHR